jgi:sterol 3beta-glucosyltransferase
MKGCDIGTIVSRVPKHPDECLADLLDTHEGAEAPTVGAVAAFGGFVASLGTDTAEFSQRLKKRPHNTDAQALKRLVSDDDPGEVSLKKGITSKQYNHLAYRMAAKSYEEDWSHNFRKPRSRPAFAAMREKVAAKKSKGGRGYQIASATAHYVCDLAATGAKGKPRSQFWRLIY